jgi:hypothetical protein
LLPTRTTTALLLAAAGLLAACASTSPAVEGTSEPSVDRFVAETSATSVLGADARFTGSPYPDVALSGLFPVHGPERCEIAVLEGGEDSFAVRLAALKGARRSIRIH